MLYINIRTGVEITESIFIHNPLKNCEIAKSMVDSMSGTEAKTFATNQPDVVSFLYYYAAQLNYDNKPAKVTLYLNNEEVEGLSDIFEFFNEALDFIGEHGLQE